jgi:hypothetical protein
LPLNRDDVKGGLKKRGSAKASRQELLAQAHAYRATGALPSTFADPIATLPVRNPAPLEQGVRRSNLRRPNVAPVATAGLIPPVPQIVHNALDEAGSIARGLPKSTIQFERDFARGVKKGGVQGGIYEAAVKPQASYYNDRYVAPIREKGVAGGLAQIGHEFVKRPVSGVLDIASVLDPAARVAFPAKGLRTVEHGAVSAQFPESASGIGRAGQSLLDAASTKLGDRTALGSQARVNKQAAKNMRQDIRRSRAVGAADARLIKGLDGPARTRLFWESQLPTEARNGSGLAALQAKFRNDAIAAEAVVKTNGVSAKDAAHQLRIARDLHGKADEIGHALQATVGNEAFTAVKRLSDERKSILEQAGVLNPDTASARESLLARTLGYDDTTGAGYVGHRAAKPPMSLQRMGQTFLGGGKTRTPPGVGQENTQRLVNQGRVRTDPNVVVEDWQYAQRYDFVNKAKDFLAAQGVPLTEFPDMRPPAGSYVVNRNGHKLPRYFNDVHPDEAAKGAGMDEMVTRDLHDYIDNTIAPIDSSQAERILAASAPEDVLIVPKQAVASFFNHWMPAGASTGNMRKFVKGVDNANAFLKGALIYANPGYIPANLIGNGAMAALHQGPFVLPNLIRSAKALGPGGDTEFRDLLFAEIGQGPTVSVVGDSRGAIQKAESYIASKEGHVADDWIRGSAWIHEARKAGLKKQAQQKALLKNAALGNEQAVQKANQIKSRVDVAMVDFDRQSPFEKAFVNRVLFVWPWIHGATRYPFKFAAEYPGRSALLTHQAEYADEKLPSAKAPSYLAQNALLSKTGDVGRIVNFGSTSMLSTPFDLLSTFGNATNENAKNTLGGMLAPQYRMMLDAAKPDIGKSSLDMVKKDAGSAVPAYTMLKDTIAGPPDSKLYGKQTRGGYLERKLGRGVIPFNVSLSEAEKRFRGELPTTKRYRYDFDQQNKAIDEAVRKGQIDAGSADALKKQNEVQYHDQLHEHALKKAGHSQDDIDRTLIIEDAKRQGIPPDQLNDILKAAGYEPVGR